jgi:hypothetical protein
MKRILPLLGLAVSLACVGFFVLYASRHWQGFASGEWTARTWRLLALALAFQLATYVSAPLAWRLSLRMTGIQASYRKLARVLSLSQIAKYLPGNVGHHVGRVYLARRIGLPADSTLLSMALDTMILLMAAAACSAPVFALTWSILRQHGTQSLRVAAAVLVILALVLLGASRLPTLRHHLVRLAALVTQLFRRGNVGLLARAWLVHCLGFVFGSSALYMLCLALAPAAHPDWLLLLGLYTAAWLLGFVMPGAPAGIGVRELVLLVGLSPLYGREHATAIAAALRLVTTLSDGTAFAAALIWSRLAQAREPMPG